MGAKLTDSAESFDSTHWSVVLRAGSISLRESEAALEELCRKYWFPLYGYARRVGYTDHDAQDVTQAFFTQFLERGYIRAADPNRGRFRWFLLVSFKHFISHERERDAAAKRGGQFSFIAFEGAAGEEMIQSSSTIPPEQAFDRLWAMTLLQRGMRALRQEYTTAGKQTLFDRIKKFLSSQPTEGDYAEVATRLKIPRSTVGVLVHRLRKRYAQLVRQEVAHTVATPEEVAGEMRYIIELISTSSASPTSVLPPVSGDGL